MFRRELLPNLVSCGVFPDGRFLSELLSKTEFLNRDKVEHDPSYKQLIPYSILRYKDSVFHYKRSAWTKETRLHRFYSIGVGGHVNKSDVLPLWKDEISAIEWARDRELTEEFWVDHLREPRLVGLLNDDSNEVGLVHFGVIYEFWLQSPKCRAKRKTQSYIIRFCFN